MDKDNAGYVKSGILFGQKENDIVMSFVEKWMELGKIIMPSEISQYHKDKYHMLFCLICGN
jgi:hypothetical protein